MPKGIVCIISKEQNYYLHPSTFQALLFQALLFLSYRKIGYSPLCCAAEHGYKDIVSILLFYGANAENEPYALCKAAEYGYTSIVSLLLQYGADVHAWSHTDTIAILL